MIQVLLMGRFWAWFLVSIGLVIIPLQVHFKLNILVWLFGVLLYLVGTLYWFVDDDEEYIIYGENNGKEKTED